MAYNGNERRHDPLTEEQLKLISSETQRAAGKALSRYRQSAIAGFLILTFGIGFVFWDSGQRAADSRHAIVQSGKAVSISGCNRDFLSAGVLRGLLLDGRQEIDKAAAKGRYPKDQLDTARKFYDRQLKRVSYPDCEAAGTILTSDRDQLPIVPKPLVPTKADK